MATIGLSKPYVAKYSAVGKAVTYSGTKIFANKTIDEEIEKII